MRAGAVVVTIGALDRAEFLKDPCASGGLEERYRRRTTIPGFEPTVIHSYPGVRTDHDGTALH